MKHILLEQEKEYISHSKVDLSLRSPVTATLLVQFF